MQRSILLTVLALGAQAAWAEDTTGPSGEQVILEETSEIVEQTTDDGVSPEVAADEMEAVEAADDGEGAASEEGESVVVEDGTEVAAEDGVAVVEDDDAVRTDNRSERGAFRGGHKGQVSTLARAGLGPVFGKLRSQGYGDISIVQTGTEISISAARAGETRQLVYDATTGALLSDVAGPSSSGILQRLSGKPRKQSTFGGWNERKGSGPSAGGKGRGNDRGGRSEKSGKGGGNGKSDGHGRGGGNGKSNGGGNGKGNGRNR